MLPVIEASRESVSSILGYTEATTLPPPAPPPAPKLLGFAMERQERSLWCWAALAKSVSHFHNPASAWIQCTIVDQELGKSVCCRQTISSCNIRHSLHGALTRTKNLHGYSTGPLPFANVVSEIDSGWVVGASIEWSGGGEHCVVLAGYQKAAGGDLIAVFDPSAANGDSLAHDWAGFQTRYRMIGTWKRTYLIRP